MTKKTITRTMIILLLVTLIFTNFTSAFAAGEVHAPKISVEKGIADTGGYLLKNVPEPIIGSIGGEWAVLGLVRSGVVLPPDYADNYYARVLAEMSEKKGELHRVKYTEYSRLILALTALGKDVTDVSGYNLLAKLADYDTVIKQGVNGPIFALIALDCHDYEIPQVAGLEVQATRQMYIDYILSKEFKAADGVVGGFAMGGDFPDPDVTGMALQGLARYQDRPEVKAVIERALDAIGKLQFSNGGFGSKGIENSESPSQMIMGLCALNIDPAADERFIKNGNTLISALMEYAISGGGFKHVPDGNVDGMATEQVYMALAAYQLMENNKVSLYDLRSIILDGIKVTLNGKNIVFTQAPIIKEGRTLVPMRAIFEALGAEVTWDNQARKVTGVLGDKTIELTIGSETAYVNGEAKALEVPGEIVSGSTLVPVRFISESLDAKVDWDAKTKTVVIVTK